MARRSTASTRVELAGENVHGIYALTTDEVLASMRSLNRGKAEAILFSGTGMVSLRAILQTEEDTGLPALSSNLCLAGKLFEELGLDGAGAIAPDAWAGRLDSL